MCGWGWALMRQPPTVCGWRMPWLCWQGGKLPCHASLPVNCSALGVAGDCVRQKLQARSLYFFAPKLKTGRWGRAGCCCSEAWLVPPPVLMRGAPLRMYPHPPVHPAERGHGWGTPHRTAVPRLRPARCSCACPPNFRLCQLLPKLSTSAYGKYVPPQVYRLLKCANKPPKNNRPRLAPGFGDSFCDPYASAVRQLGTRRMHGGCVWRQPGRIPCAVLGYMPRAPPPARPCHTRARCVHHPPPHPPWASPPGPPSPAGEQHRQSRA